MAGRIEARLTELKIELPQPGAPLANYVPFVRTGDLLFIAGQVCQWNGERRFIGKLGREVTLEQGQQAARLCALNILAVAKSALGGDLDRIVRCVRLGGFVNSLDDFTQQPQVVNGASDLVVQLLGDAGRHARTAVGVNVLPWRCRGRGRRHFRGALARQMADGGESVTVKVVSRLADIPAAAWDACAGADNPFLCHAFLEALEASGSANGAAGWLPQHLALEGEDGRLLGAVPLYLKSHSYGEYVFDHGWASAYERAGGHYYPKLQCSVPFTPVTGPRLLLHPEAGPAVADGLIAAMVALARRHKVSSLHVTFPTQGEWERLGAAGFLQRMGQQFHWENDGYRSFEDFLAALNSRKRKQIRRERRDALAGGIEIETLTGGAIEPRHWDAFFRFYMLDLRSQMGRRLSDTRLLRSHRPAHGRAHRAGDGEKSWALYRRRTQSGRAATRSTAAIGAAPAIFPSCISRCATTAPSISPSRTG